MFFKSWSQRPSKNQKRCTAVLCVVRNLEKIKEPDEPVQTNDAIMSVTHGWRCRKRGHLGTPTSSCPNDSNVGYIAGIGHVGMHHGSGFLDSWVLYFLFLRFPWFLGCCYCWFPVCGFQALCLLGFCAVRFLGCLLSWCLGFCFSWFPDVLALGFEHLLVVC